MKARGRAGGVALAAVLLGGCWLAQPRAPEVTSEGRRSCVRGCEEAHGRCTQWRWGGSRTGQGDWLGFLVELAARAVFASPCINELRACYAECDEQPPTLDAPPDVPGPAALRRPGPAGKHANSHSGRRSSVG